MSLWKSLKKPIVGLAPMDGVSDAAFRFVVDEVSKPSVLFTEFVPVEAIKASAQRVLDAFVSHATDTPVVAQLYGTDLEAYYISTLVVCELGFEGVDINMGCPAKSVESRGAGAGLIKNPELAKEIVNVVKKAANDYFVGSYNRNIIPDKIKSKIEEIKIFRCRKDNHPIPVSVKTRIGHKENEVETWISFLASQKIDCITIHGRTYLQMYKGKADWEAISRSAEIIKSIDKQTIFLGNGDVKSYKQAEEIVKEHPLVDGVLVGRAALGNPWVLGDALFEAGKEDKFRLMLLHAKKFTEFYPNGHFLSLRKHLLWYSSGFEGSRELHTSLQKVQNFEELSQVIRF